MRILRNQRTKMLGLSFILFSVMSLVFYTIGAITTKKYKEHEYIQVDDPIVGWGGPLLLRNLVDTQCMSEKKLLEKQILAEENRLIGEKKKCRVLARQCQYIFYHTLWHILTGFVALLFAIIITIK
jgi:predicted membrane channel-forming protein YqfA (hemolysin III family)